MDAWLSELEMAWNEDPNVGNINNIMMYKEEEDEMEKLNEELAAVLGEDFCLTSCSNNNADTTTNTTLLSSSSSSSLLQLDHYCTTQQHQTPPTNLFITQFDQQLPTLSDAMEPLFMTTTTNIIHDDQLQDKPPSNNANNNSCNNKNSSISGDEHATKKMGRKRRRDPDQVQDHIMAERKRRELLAQQFIALSALVPDLKKIDKTSILEAAIRHLKQMQERVKVLEEGKSKRKEMVMNKENEKADGSICLLGGSEEDEEVDKGRNGVPEIEVKLTPKTVLLRICCGRRKGVLRKIYEAVEHRGMSVVNSNLMLFETSTLNITILAKIERAEGYEKQVKDLLKSLHSSLK